MEEAHFWLQLWPALMEMYGNRHTVGRLHHCLDCPGWGWGAVSKGVLGVWEAGFRGILGRF